MTTNYPVSTESAAISTPPSDESDTKAVAKEQATSVGQGATEAGQHVAGVAKDLLDQARTELGTQGGQQQQRLATSLHALGDELHSMANNNDQPGAATDLARQAAGKTKDVASWLENREPGDVLSEVSTFARQRPVAFLALAFGAGLLAGRITRGVKDAPSSTDSTDTARHAQSPIAQSVYTPSEPSAYALPAEDVRPFASSQDSSAEADIFDRGNL